MKFNSKKLKTVVIMTLVYMCYVWTPTEATTADPADYQIVMVVKQGDAWFDDMETGVKQLKKDTGLNVSVQYPETDEADNQIEIVENLINQGVNAICIVPNDPEALENVIKKAKSAGIVVVTHEAPSLAGKVDLDLEAFVNAEFGKLFGENMAEAMGETGLYAGIVGGKTMDTHMQWYLAAVDYIEENYPDMECVPGGPAEDGNNEDGAYDVTKELLDEYPDLKGIFDCSAYGNGVCRAVEEKRGEGQVKVVSLAIPSESSEYVENGQMESILAWRPADAGYATCYAAYLLASGQNVESGTDLKAAGYECVTVNDGIAYGNAPLEYTIENISDYRF